MDKANYYFTKATDLGGDIPEIWIAHVRFLYESRNMTVPGCAG
jgi:hypothetical protein